MIKTGLPYDFENMQQIAEEGAIVDMSDIHYPSIDSKDNVKTTFIYLRNTGFKNITLDFSKADYNTKLEFLLYYINNKHSELPLYEFNSTLLHLMLKSCDIDHKTEGIFSDEEDASFMKNEEHMKIIEQLKTLAISLPLYLFSRLDCEDFTIDFDDIEKTDETFYGNLIIQLMQLPEYNLIYSKDIEIKPKFYTELFTMDNDSLFNGIQSYTPFGALMYGLTDEEGWKQFTDSLLNYFYNS